MVTCDLLASELTWPKPRREGKGMLMLDTVPQVDGLHAVIHANKAST